MSDSFPLPPVRLHSEAELRGTRSPRRSSRVPCGSPAGRSGHPGRGRWRTVKEQLPAAAAELGLDGGDAAAYASEAWRVAVDTGSSRSSTRRRARSPPAPTWHSSSPERLQDVLGLWLGALETVLADASVPTSTTSWRPWRRAARSTSPGWTRPRGGGEFLDGVLGDLYLLTAMRTGPGRAGAAAALAASMIVPDDMGEPTNDVLEQVSDAMMRLNDQFRLLEPVGLVDFQPVDEALMADIDEEPRRRSTTRTSPGTGWCRLMPLGVYGIGARLLESGFAAPRWATSRTRGRTCCSTVPLRSAAAAQAETEQWLTRVNPSPPHGSCSRRRRAPMRGRRCGGCAVSRRCRSSVRRPRRRSATSWTTQSWAGSRGSGSPSGPRTCPRRPRRWSSG